MFCWFTTAESSQWLQLAVVITKGKHILKLSKMNKIILEVEFKDHDKVVLTNENGDTFTSKNEDLIDFLHYANKKKLQHESKNIKNYSYFNNKHNTNSK